MDSNESLLQLKGQVVIVTGAGGGIGKAIAERLHSSGMSVGVVDIHHDNAHSVSNYLNSLRPDSACAIHADVSNEEGAKQIVDETMERYGQIDVLVNNAGIFPSVPVLDMSYEKFDTVVKTNLYSVYLLSKLCAARMVERGNGGKIINITSIDALHPSMIGLAHYDASKHAVWGFTKNLALELAPHRIWVNAIAPGGVATPGVAALRTEGADPELMQQAQEAFLARIPMHRMGEPDDIAKVALFLASAMSSYMTGEQIVVDGGALLM